MSAPDIKTRAEADRLRRELETAEPAYTMEPDGISIREAEWTRQQFKANRLRHVETRLIRSAAQLRRDSAAPFQRNFER
jgi:hypothetical protein